MNFGDFGFYNYASVYIVRDDTLSNPDTRANVKAFMKAEVRGWQDAIADPTLGAKFTNEKYGKDLGLEPKAQMLAAAEQNKLIVTNDPKRGILTLDPAVLPKTIHTLSKLGVDVTEEQLFDTTLMDEVYDGKTSL